MSQRSRGPSMKILFDFRAYQEFYPRGVSRYVYELFTNVFKLSSSKNYILVDKNKRMPDIPSDINADITYYDINKFENDEVKERFDFFINGSTTWLGLQQYNSLDVLYPESVMKLCDKKTCILYDFVPLLYGHYLPNTRDQVNYFLQCEAMKYMDHIFTISKYVSSSGARYLGRALSDFTCLYGGADSERFHTLNSELPYDSSKRTNNLVNISGICIRKNFAGVTTAFCKAYNSGKIPSNAKLMIVCSSADFFVNEIKEETKKAGLKYGKHVIATGFISDNEMVNLLATARASIYPSYYEGLGLPILESYTAGTPCIASNVSSMKELVYKDASFNPFKIDEVTNKIIEIYNNEELCKESLTFGRKLIKEINWENSAKILFDKLEEIYHAK